MKKTLILVGALAGVALFALTSHAEDMAAPKTDAGRLDLKVAVADAAAAQKGGAALSFVKKATDEGLSFLADTSLTREQKRSRFSTLLSRNFDLDTIGKFALGPYWRQATPEQQAQYLKLFKSMVVEVYTNRFEEYNGQTLTVDSEKPVTGTDTLVISTIHSPDGGQKVQVGWRVRAKGNQMRIVDVIVEGVSMSVTQRSDFASVIQNGGGNVDALISHLKGGSAAKTAKSST
jgi:phospholipid transport system substrate-binding protein